MASILALPSQTSRNNPFSPHGLATVTEEPAQVARKQLAKPDLRIDTQMLVVSIPAPPPPAARIPRPAPALIREAPSADERPPNSLSQAPAASSDGGAQSSPTIRSIFPVFNPSAPFAVPSSKATQNLTSIANHAAGEGRYSPSIYSRQRHSIATGDYPCAPGPRAEIISKISPLRVAEQASLEISGPEGLLDLWSMAGGQASEEVSEMYTLGLKSGSLDSNKETLTFISSTSAIYTLQASAGELRLSRSHPVDPTIEVEISKTSLRVPTTTSPLVASLFPCIAELKALDTASNIALSNRLSRHDSIGLQNEAVARARSDEAASLLWDSDSGQYFLAHPCLRSLSPDAVAPSSLPIEISPESSICFRDTSGQPLLALDLASRGLTVHVLAIAGVSESSYTLDVLLSAMLVLLLHLHRCSTGPKASPAPLPLPHFDPPPTFTGRSRSRAATKAIAAEGPRRSLTRWFSMRDSRRPNGFVRSDVALSVMGDARSIEPKDLEAGTLVERQFEIPPMSVPIPPSGVAPELSKSNTGVDLSRFQAFDLNDPELPRTTRVLLRIIYWSFGVTVWVLGVVVGCIAAAVVAISSCLGGKGLGRDG